MNYQVLTASNFYQRINCPASFKRQRESEAEYVSTWAQAGIELHRLVHKDPGCWPYDLYDRLYYAYLAKDHVIDEFFLSCATAKKESYKKMIEQEVYYKGRYVARLDFLLLGKKEALIIEFKFGEEEPEGILSSSSNKQLKLQALGVHSTYKVNDVYGCLIQSGESQRQTSRIYHIDRKELKIIEELYNKTYERIVSEDPEERLGVWCTYCSGKITCRAFNKMMDNLVYLAGGIK